MGIEGLGLLLHSAYKSIHISTFENRTAVVDAMSWLYRGCYACSYELNTNAPTTDYLMFIYKMIGLLRRNSITPIMVFDGRNLPAKKKTEEARKRTKRENREKAEQLLKEGKEKEAKKFFSRALKITKEMIYLTIDILRKMDIECIVAPYEADAQLAYLLKNGYAHFAISEDSDLILFGCEKIVYKLKDSGMCSYLNLEELYSQPNVRKQLKDEALKIFISLSLENKIFCGIMAGCDYLPPIRGMGLRKAIDFFHRFRAMESVVRRLRTEKKFMGKVPPNYEETVKHISLIFKYQRIYEPRERRMTTLNPLPQNGVLPEDINELIGSVFDDSSNFAAGLLEIKRLVLRGPKSAEVEDFFQKIPIKGAAKTPVKSAEKEKPQESAFPAKPYDQKHVFGMNNEDNGGESPSYLLELMEELENYEAPEKNEEKAEVNELVAQEVAFLFELCKEYSRKNALGSDGDPYDQSENFAEEKKIAEDSSSLREGSKSPMRPIVQQQAPQNPFELSAKNETPILDSVAKLKQEIIKSPMKGGVARVSDKPPSSPIKTVEKNKLLATTAADLKRKTIDQDKTVSRGDIDGARRESFKLEVAGAPKKLYDISNFFQKKN